VFALFGRFFQETGGTLKNEVHFDSEGRITESWFFPAKASEVDQFWA
jgi:hypothetical protein